MKTKYIGFILLLILFSSCKKDEVELSSTNYLIFGSFSPAWCNTHDCSDTYRLEEDQLLEGKTKYGFPSGDFYQSKYTKLSKQQFNDVKDLITYFPPDLLLEPDTVIGMPGATDGGGLYIEYNYGGVRKFWLLDGMKYKVPAKYHSFIDKVNEKLKLLQ